jgi:hypothetical protein
MFPANVAGFALVILRCCVALQLVVASPEAVEGDSPMLRTILVGAIMLALCLGAFTPVVCLVTVLLH